MLKRILSLSQVISTHIYIYVEEVINGGDKSNEHIDGRRQLLNYRMIAGNGHFKV